MLPPSESCRDVPMWARVEHGRVLPPKAVLSSVRSTQEQVSSPTANTETQNQDTFNNTRPIATDPNRTCRMRVSFESRNGTWPTLSSVSACPVASRLPHFGQPTCSHVKGQTGLIGSKFVF